MFEKLGDKAVVLAFLYPAIMFCILGLALTPMLRAQMDGIPFAVVTLDEGSSLPISDVNVGDELVDRLLSGEGLSVSDEDGEDAGDGTDGMFGNAGIVWAQMSSEQELRDALAANQYYGGIVIPRDFTAQQMLSATGLGGAPTLKVLINDAKNPMLAQQMGPNIKSALLQAGISVDVEEVNQADIGGGTMAPMMAVQMIVMPLVIMTLIASIVVSLVLWPRKGATRRARLAAFAKQLVAGAFLSAFIAFLGAGIDVWFGGLDLPMERLFPLLWLAVGAMMCVVVALCDLFLPLGVLVGIATFALGMGCAMIAYEMLPAFWQEWVYPWVPQHYLGDDVRALVYLGSEAISANLGYWVALFDVGTVAFVLALLVPQKSRAAQDGTESPIAARKRKMQEAKVARHAKAAARKSGRAGKGEGAAAAENEGR